MRIVAAAVRGAAAMALAAAATLAVPPPAARATVEEFSTFSIPAQENDDESVLDHLLTLLPHDWNDAWAHRTGGFRTSQGCLTSGQWFIFTDFKARAPLGNRAWFGVDLLQSESDILNVDNLDLSFHFPQAAGSAFAMFRPTAAKAAQDFALGWETGADTSAFQLRATWTLEDVFNNFWAFRQTQVGELSEPYERRPYEPAIEFAVRRPNWRIEADAKWLTPSRKRIVDIGTGQAIVNRDLWGATGGLLAEARVGRVVFEVSGRQRQANSHDWPLVSGTAETSDYRRLWVADGAVRTTWPDERTTIETRYLYQSNTGHGGLVVFPWHLQADHRLVNLDVTHAFSPRVTARAGGIYDRIGVAADRFAVFTYGTRNESRAYIGLQLRFGRVMVAGVEGIELDPEPYDVWFVHDKGFLQLQTTF